jgi:hypothetical protein
MNSQSLRSSLVVEHSRRNNELSRTVIEQPVELISAQRPLSHENVPEETIQEREREILGIEQGIQELSEIFHDLGTVVEAQGAAISEIQAEFW